MKIKWREGTPAPEGHAYHTAVFYDGNVYVGGGINRGNRPSFKIEIYSLEKDKWKTSIDLSHCWCAMTTFNNQLIIAGGQASDFSRVTKKMFVLLENNKLQLYCRKMTRPRYKASAVGHQGTLIIVGGVTDENKVISSTELFDSNTKQWYATNELPIPQYGLQSVVADNIVYLLGGIGQDGKASPSVFTASLDTLLSLQLKWISHQDFPWLRSAPVSIQGRHVLVMGGAKLLTDSNAFTSTSSIRMFNNISDKWDVIGQMPFERRAPAAAVVSDKIVVIGGVNYKDQVTDGVWIGSCQPQ